MTHGSLWDKILLYALPVAATGILQQLFNAADIAVIGKFVGKEAMAAVGSNSPVIGLLVNLFVGLALGTNVVLATALGSGNRETVHRGVHTSLLVALLGGLCMTAVGELAASPLLHLLGVPPEVLDMAVLYLRVYMLGMPVIMLYNFAAAIFRSEGNTRMPLIALTISGVINVGLNVFFVLVLHMTVNGVALATVLSNLISASILIVKLSRSESEIRLEWRELRLSLPILKKIMRIGIPAGLQNMVFSLANVVIQSAINSLGATVMAASAAGFNLEIFAYFVLNSFTQACTTFVGQNNGAGERERCRRTLKTSLLLDAAFTAATCLLILAFSRPLLGLFNSDPEVIAVGQVRMRWMFSAYGFNLLQEMFSAYMRGYGYSLEPALMSLLGICGTRLLWIFLVFPRNPVFSTVMKVYPISLGLSALLIIGVVLWKRPGEKRVVS
jgi:putative MATE family efflux protein